MDERRSCSPRPDTHAPIFTNSFEAFADQGPLTVDQLDTSLLDSFEASGQHLESWEVFIDLEQLDNQASTFNWNAVPEALDGLLPLAESEPVETLYAADSHHTAAPQPTQLQTAISPDWNAEPSTSFYLDQDFLQWVDGAYRPPAPCSYCRYHRLQCLIIRTTQVNPNPVTACSSCVALFRECSLAIGEKRKASEFETNQPIIGHLHGVNEECQDGLELLSYPDWQAEAGAGAGAGAGAESSFVQGEKKEGEPVVKVTAVKSKRSISKQDIRVLKAWLSEHRHSPYPSEDEKLELRATTGLTILQISNWFANARRRQRQIQSVPIPPGRGKLNSGIREDQSDFSPISRWKNSPPEDNPVDPAALAKAIAASKNGSSAWAGISPTDGTVAYPQHRSFDNRSSRETSLSASDSSNSAWSHSSWASHRSFTSPSRPKRRRQQKQNMLEKAENKFSLTFHCTFCPVSFKKRHDWQRHEKSIHLSLEHWICCSGDGTIPIPHTTAKQCIFCSASDPTEGHLISHEFNTCSDRPVAERTFKRKDHLRQHLIKFHGLSKPSPSVFALWKVEWGDLKSRCGFCDEWLGTWEARVEHLAGHFKDGAVMNEWVGDWGFDADVLGLLQGAELPGVGASG
ncbi:uncharacterized protein L3040_008752 [Drepanopeziza brunnea f. sp. 'multigermtubi']|uniref:uncharacterized protein n=1 Tax=Drepanopeziza brunnea f. sp. 'multigermtubi' TaxID=698441 RepID=UPI0023853863|nr:hypothetical protein L3040_008752 [Drepanopeziza brunnea f. sp. 'multigermtubi']